MRGIISLQCKDTFLFLRKKQHSSRTNGKQMCFICDVPSIAISQNGKTEFPFSEAVHL